MTACADVIAELEAIRRREYYRCLILEGITREMRTPITTQPRHGTKVDTDTPQR